MNLNVSFSLDKQSLTIQNANLEWRVEGVESVRDEITDDGGLSVPFLKLNATVEGEPRSYCMWEDLPVIYMPSYAGGQLMELPDVHWVIRSVHLSAFTDDNDTLVYETKKNLFTKNAPFSLSGEIFLFENPQDGSGMVIISECPDFCTATLNIRHGLLSVENGGCGLAVGFCKAGECEALCRDYYRHACRSHGLVAMSNTWGDAHGDSRVCDEFVRLELQAGEEIGVDIVQIDDGWAVGKTSDTSPNRRLNGRRIFNDDFWELDETRFPKGMRSVADDATTRGLKLGMWFAPDFRDHFALRYRDISILKKAYDEWGVRFFKLDMYWVESKEDMENFLELLAGVYAFGPDVAVQLDVTRNARVNYLCGRQYGTIFVENRYTRTANSFPHRVLRSLWSIGRYIPTNKFQFELINPDLNVESYREGDSFAPVNFDMDYLFAVTMLSNPLFWMEMQFLSKERREQLAPLMKIWKQHRGAFANADVLPIGDEPSGASLTGFSITAEDGKQYLLLFRETTETARAVMKAPVKQAGVKVLASNAEVKAEVADGCVCVEFSKPRAYALLELEN